MRPAEHPEKTPLNRIVESLLLKEHTPPCAIVNRREQVLYIHGRTGKYLEPAPGEVNLRITDMAREGLQIPLAEALHSAYSSGMDVERHDISVKTNGGFKPVNIIVKPLAENAAMKDCFLILFQDASLAETPKEKNGKRKRKGEDTFERILTLERELSRGRKDYQSAVEELRNSNEELKSYNEEMQSANEELQSSNEELESSREELHSLNEELSTVNSELHNKIEELANAYSTITDVLNSTRIAIIFLDRDMKVKRFTDEATKVMNLIETDIGRPVHHITPNFEYDKLGAKVQRAIHELESMEDEIRTLDDRWYLMRIMPYRTFDDKIKGAVLTFINIDVFKRKPVQSLQ